MTTPTLRHSAAYLDAERARIATQPGLGFMGLLVVVPLSILLGFGRGGAEHSAVILSPLVTFALPVLAMIAFWWEDWPGSSLRPAWAAIVDTFLIAAAGVALALVGQAVVGHFDFSALFDPTPQAGSTPLYPAAMPLGLTVFTAILQLTLVCEGWPFKRLPRLVAGFAALTLSWGIALIVQYTALQFTAPDGSGVISQEGPLSHEDISVMLALCGALQVWIFLVWRGWPLNKIGRRWLRITFGNLLVLSGTGIGFLILDRGMDMAPGEIVAIVTSASTGGLIVAMLFEGVFRSRMSAAWERVATISTSVALGAALFGGLITYADTLTWTTTTAEGWVAHICVTSLGLSVLLHVGVSRRWPLRSTNVPAYSG
ncbi:hypothetical protein [Streptomyces sp. NPDC127036]|uniref:hypothetical protein n=1 Tax=Streptomyces sp. NPDC127036 TaxID=3347112 RepID=UPI003648EB77